MKEDFLHYCWKFKKFSSLVFELTTGENLHIISFGIHNHDQGPDFLNAEIEIEGIKWIGNIEIHVNSSDWNNHNHHHDSKYNNVILHVVFNHNKDIINSNGSQIPTLELKNYIDSSLIDSYNEFIKPSLPCASFLPEIDHLTLLQFKDRFFVERLDYKSKLVNELLIENNGDWLETFFQLLAKSFGIKVNQQAFLELSQTVSIKIVQRLGDEFKTEAVLLGNSGLLNVSSDDSYIKDLQKEYNYQKGKFSFYCMPYDTWKFSKMRPSNFPTIRIVQLAKLITSSQNLLDDLVISKPSYEKIFSRLNIVIEEGYWLDHYTIDNISKPAPKSIGKQMVNSIIINTIVPFAYWYGKLNKVEYLNWIDSVMEEISYENNKVTRLFSQIQLEHAKDSQAVIHCYNTMCINKKCLDCVIGSNILRKKQDQ